MSIPFLILLLVGGVLLLYVGAELLVLYSSKLAVALGMTTLMAGLTIVAISTSLPEMVTSLIAQIDGRHGSIALGNVVGSNIVNIGLILGFVALIKPLPIDTNIRNFEAPLGIALVSILWLIMLSGQISRAAGIGLFIGFLLYLMKHVWDAKQNKKLETGRAQTPWTKKILYIALLLIGIGITIVGGYIFIKGAIQFAKIFNVPDRVIGLTLVAVGTSLPEFAASFVALSRKMPNIVIGNIFGSNIFNILLIVSVVAIIIPIEFSPKFLSQDMPFIFIFSVLIWCIAYFKRQISRLSGLFLLICYGGYLYYLI